MPLSDGRSRRQRADGGEHRRELADVGEVDVGTVAPVGSGDGEPRVVQLGACAEARQDAAQGVAGLGRTQRPVGHGDLAAGDHGGREERRGVGQVRLDDVPTDVQGARLDPPGVVVDVLDDGAGAAQHRDRHGDVGAGGQPASLMANLDAVGEPGRGQQEGDDELGRQRGVEGDAAAEQPAAAVHRQRQPVAVRGHRTPRARSAVTIGPSRSFPGPEVAVEMDVAVGQRRDRGQEAHDRPGVPDVDRRGAAQGRGRNSPVLAHVLDGRSERSQAGRHEGRVPAAQRGDAVGRAPGRARRARARGWSATWTRAVPRSRAPGCGRRGPPSSQSWRDHGAERRCGPAVAAARIVRRAALGVLRGRHASSPGGPPGRCAGCLRPHGGWRAGAPGEAWLALGVDRREHQPAEQAEVLEEVDALLAPVAWRPSPPRTGDRPGSSGRGCRRAAARRAAGTGPVRAAARRRPGPLR